MSNSLERVSDVDFYTARLRAVDDKVGYPYFRTALYSLIPVVTNEVPTCGTDRWWRIYINLHYFASLTADEAAMVLIHEIWHPLGMDWDRALAKGVTPATRLIWNIARDNEINAKDKLLARLPQRDYVDAQGNHHVQRPCSAALLGLPQGLFAEEMYDLLLVQQPNLVDPGGPPALDRTPAACSGDCGSAADGITRPWELPAPDQCDTPGQPESRIQLIQQATARAMIEHASQTCGKVPAGWLRWAKNIINPKVRWQDELRPTVRGFLTRAAGGSIPTRRRIGRRQMSDPRLLPSARLRLRQRVAFIMDTSGSMSDDMLSQGAAEIDGVCLALGREVEVAVYATDSAAYTVQHVRSAEKVCFYGGGGTDMGEGFKAIQSDALKDPALLPDLVVCLTDGYTPWPPAMPFPAYYVVVILTKEGSEPSWCVPPDGKVIRTAEKS